MILGIRIEIFFCILIPVLLIIFGAGSSYGEAQREEAINKGRKLGLNIEDYRTFLDFEIELNNKLQKVAEVKSVELTPAEYDNLLTARYLAEKEKQDAKNKSSS